MTIQETYDVLIMGGGLAGLSLALQLKQNASSLRILVAEKAQPPFPEAAHKVGESSVEIGSHYFQEILGLQSQLDQELPKLGLRFFYTQGDNQDIAKRAELGPSDFLHVRSYQIDRGRFENALIQACLKLGITIWDQTTIREIALGQLDHQVMLHHQDKKRSVQVKWIVDASGRASLLKRKLKLLKPMKHDVNASWFRIKHEINIDDWVPQQKWKDRVTHSRRISTNHLFGKGYWVWLIPLASGSTSIGIVADAKLHPFSHISTFDKALVWLEQHEPQCAKIVKQHLDVFQDFHTLKHYSHNCKQMYSSEGWCITGDAGAFLDPLYSPGSDFIAIGNTFICDLITKQQSGKSISLEVREYERIFRSLFLGYTPIYENQYPMMGNAKVMSLKIIWDFVMYWGGVALLFMGNKFCALEFMEKARKDLQRFFVLNLQMQQLFNNWDKEGQDDEENTGLFIDYAKISFLRKLNESLLINRTSPELLHVLSQNFKLAQELSYEIISDAIMNVPQLNNEELEYQEPSSDHLKDILSCFSHPVSGQKEKELTPVKHETAV